ncbi:hypothetical protein DVH05_003846 [Phytophthora capsici]|nr:hypothetical protein DVH05_003846 [Phytophthora capsici]
MRPVTYMHPFVIPVDLTRSMEAAIKTARAEQKEPDALDHRIKKQGIVLDLVASIDPKLWKFSGAFVGALTTFYAVKTKIRSWFEDRTSWGVGWPAAPKDPITGSSPDEFEWKPLGVVIVRLHYDEATEKLNVRVYMYEPLIDKDYHEKMEMVWGGVMEKNKLV